MDTLLFCNDGYLFSLNNKNNCSLLCTWSFRRVTSVYWPCFSGFLNIDVQLTANQNWVLLIHHKQETGRNRICYLLPFFYSFLNHVSFFIFPLRCFFYYIAQCANMPQLSDLTLNANHHAMNSQMSHKLQQSRYFFLSVKEMQKSGWFDDTEV